MSLLTGAFPLWESSRSASFADVMILDESDIHVEKEAGREILDWDRTYFLTKYYSI